MSDYRLKNIAEFPDEPEKIWLYWSPFTDKWFEATYECKAVMTPERDIFYFVGEFD